MASLVVGPLLNWFSRLRYPQLFLLTAAIFAVDVAVPDLIPFLDELLIGLSARMASTTALGSAPYPTRSPSTSALSYSWAAA